MALAIAGIGIGIITALLLSQLMSSLLFGVSSSDLTTYVVVSTLLLAVATVSCYLPARRAVKVDPVIALRHE